MKCSCLTNSDAPGLEHLDHCPLSKDKTVTVFRNAAGRPFAVPEEIVTAEERAYRAYNAHRDGLSWEIVAAQENYPTAAAAAADVKRYLDEGKALLNDYDRRQLLAIEVDRLNYIQTKIWPAVEQGHLPAVNTALSIILSRVKIQKLDEERDDENLGAGRTVVVMGDSESYVAALKKASES